MSLYGVCASVVLSGLFFRPSILALASAVIAGIPNPLNATPAAAAPPASAAPVRNLRRFQNTSLGVISDETISDGFLINILHPTLVRAPLANGCVPKYRTPGAQESFRLKNER